MKLQKRSPALLCGHGVVRQEVTAIQITLGQHARHTLDGRQIEIHVEVDNANLAGHDLEKPEASIDRLPKSQHVWTKAERSTFHDLMAPSARSLVDRLGVDGALNRALKTLLERARIFAQDEEQASLYRCLPPRPVRLAGWWRFLRGLAD
ncbi:MAG TPA: hypothetical protein VIS71_07680 [Terrimicrobium sp.]